MSQRKADTINKIIALTQGKPYKVIKARPALDFELIDKDKCLFVCKQTGRQLTWLKIQRDIIVDTQRWWGSCSIANCPEGDEVYFTSIWMYAIEKDEIFFPEAPLVYSGSIHVNIDEYVEGEYNI